MEIGEEEDKNEMGSISFRFLALPVVHFYILYRSCLLLLLSIALLQLYLFITYY